MTPSVPVSVHGFTWTASLVAVLNVLVGGAIVAWIKARPKMRELEQTADAKLIDTLAARVGNLEQQIERKQQDHEKAIGLVMQALNQERANHEAELALHRHATRNAKQILIGILDLIEAAPEKAGEHAAKMRSRMIELDKAEAEEAARIRGARIIAAATPANC